MPGRALPMRGATSTSSCEVAPTFASFSWILAARACARRSTNSRRRGHTIKACRFRMKRPQWSGCSPSSTALRLLGTGVYQHGRLIAFSIIELLESGYAMGHFAKCDAGFSGLSHYLYQATARATSDRGCRYLNVQEDLGIAGLRTFKMLLRPVSFLKKYAVTCRAACAHRPASGCLHARNSHLRLRLLFRCRLGETLQRQAAAHGSAATSPARDT